MGFFNFLYKLTNIFSNKRKLKVFIILFLILILVFCWSRGCFANEPTPTDQNSLMNYQLQLQRSMVDYVTFLYKFNNINQSQFNTFIAYLRAQNVYVTTSINDSTKYIVYFYNNNQPGTNNFPNTFTTEGTWELGVLNGGQVSGTAFPCMLSEFTGMVSVIYLNDQLSVQRNPSPVTSTTFWLPDGCYLVRSTAIDELLETVNAYSELPTTYKTNDDELQALTRAGFNSVNSNIQQQTQEMTNSINNASTSISNSVDNLNNTISDTTTDDNQVQFAQDNNQDLTSGFFTNLFNSFQNAFTNNAIVGVEFNIPFTNRSFTFSNRYVRTLVEQNESFQPIVVLATAFWWFALGYYVILDIYKKINAIKSGDLTNIENENITTDLM